MVAAFASLLLLWSSFAAAEFSRQLIPKMTSTTASAIPPIFMTLLSRNPNEPGVKFFIGSPYSLRDRPG
jgi:hypothetical protein